MRVNKIVARYVDASSGNLPAGSSELVTFDKSFDQLYVYSHFETWVKETIFECRLISLGNSCSLINWHGVDEYAPPLLARSRLFAPVPDW